eukprot:26081-Amphidinium_carterae.1
MSAGAFALAITFDGHLSARSATVRNPPSEKVVCTWYGIDRGPNRALRSESRANHEDFSSSGQGCGGQVGCAMTINTTS